MVRRLRPALLLTLLLLVAGCSATAPQVRREAGFAPPVEPKVLYVVPFVTVMVPPEVQEGVFDLFVDALNAEGRTRRHDFVILKEGAEGVDPGWLAGQNYITGEIFGYVEESGCCSTTIRVKSRLQLHQPGQAAPTLLLEYPQEVFFEHDYSSAEQERRKLAAQIATTLAARLLAALGGS